MIQTETLLLNKIELQDVPDITVINPNWDILEREIINMKSKLSGVEEGANNYMHPLTHSPSVITQDSNNRFVTDVEKSTWNNKADVTHTHAIESVAGLQGALGEKAPLEHTHAISQVNGLQGELDSLKTSVGSGKTLVANAITDKGVGTLATDTFGVMAENIKKITTQSVLSGDAMASDVLSGKTFYSNNPVNKITGSMPNRGAVTQTLSANGASYTIPQGYHNGSGVINASISNLLAPNVKSGVNIGGVVGTFTSDATATASRILSGYTAYANGNKITGNYTPSFCADQLCYDTGNMSGSSGNRQLTLKSIADGNFVTSGTSTFRVKKTGSYMFASQRAYASSASAGLFYFMVRQGTSDKGGVYYYDITDLMDTGVGVVVASLTAGIDYNLYVRWSGLSSGVSLKSVYVAQVS